MWWRPTNVLDGARRSLSLMLGSFVAKFYARLVSALGVSFAPRLHVRSQHHGGQSGSGRRSRFQSNVGPPVWCAQSTSEYEAAAVSLVSSTDVVLEIGCALGATTRLLHDTGAAVIGVDIDRKPAAAHVHTGRYRQTADPSAAGLPDVALHILDVWDILALQEACATSGTVGVSIVLVDSAVILGNDLPFELFTLVRQIGRLFAPTIRAVLVKSRALSHLQHQLVAVPMAAGRRRLAAPSRRVYAPRVELVAAKGVHDYRQAALERVRPGATVLEIGCHIGTSTVLLHDAAAARGGCCVGVDVGKDVIARARTLYPHVTFQVCDAWDSRALLRCMERCGAGAPELVLLDVGGLSGASGFLDALALLKQLSATLAPTLKAIVIKSTCVRAAAMQLRPARELGLAGAHKLMAPPMGGPELGE